MKEFVALIIDLKKSRGYSTRIRNNIQEYIIKVIEVLNEVFHTSLEKKVEFSAGDEVQGLFSSTEASYLYFRMFSMLVSPIEVRAGMGVGEWEVVIKEAGTTAQDGKAYHNARYAIEATEESLGYSVLLYSGKETDITVNSLLNSTALIINKQSEYQNEVMLLSELLYPINVDDIINVHEMKRLIALLRYKRYFAEYDSLKRHGKDKEPLFYRVADDEIDSKILDVMEDKDSFFVVAGKVRGLPTKLSRITGITRQSMEKTVKAANIYEARNLAVTTIKYLRNLGDK